MVGGSPRHPSQSIAEQVRQWHPREDAPEAEKVKVDALGDMYGGHHGATSRGSGLRWVGDHQPPNGLILAAKMYPDLMTLLEEAKLPTSLRGQRLYPQSSSNSNRQGGVVSTIVQFAKQIAELKNEGKCD